MGGRSYACRNDFSLFTGLLAGNYCFAIIDNNRNGNFLEYFFRSLDLPGKANWYRLKYSDGGGLVVAMLIILLLAVY